ncbi:MIP/aquaporin family protein [Aeoliella mucimassa]|nr:MIP family channel protein [Aeoliella mucimassa]
MNTSDNAPRVSTSFQRYFAEAIGTFALVFLGAGAAAVDSATGGAITHVGIAIVFGLVVFAIISAIGEQSGAHINPAVTLGFWISGRFASRDVLPYIVAQCLGAIVAGSALKLLFTQATSLGETLPRYSAQQSFLLEIILTWFLMYVILSVATRAKEEGLVAGLAIGATVGLLAMMGGPICGASMNPARSLGPALASGNLQMLWIYLIGPTIGAALAVFTYKITHN